MKELIIATKNKGKVAEFAALFEAFGIRVSSLLDVEGMPDVEETGTTFEENARLKAEQISAILNKPVLADDSGLVIDALDGRPGVYSARYAGINATDKENNERVLRELKTTRSSQRGAHFICVLALAIPGEETIYKSGKCHGKIADAPSGTNGFGYDPIFIPEQYDVTMAHLENDVKNTISHRYHALEELKKWLDEHAEKVF